MDNSDKIRDFTVPKGDTSEYEDSLTTVSNKYGSKDDEGLMLVCSINDSENTEVCTNVSDKDNSKYDEGLMLVFSEVSNGDSSEYDKSATTVSNKDTTGNEERLVLLSSLDNSVKVKGLFTDSKEDTSE